MECLPDPVDHELPSWTLRDVLPLSFKTWAEPLNCKQAGVSHPGNSLTLRLRGGSVFPRGWHPETPMTIKERFLAKHGLSVRTTQGQFQEPVSYQLWALHRSSPQTSTSAAGPCLHCSRAVCATQAVTLRKGACRDSRLSIDHILERGTPRREDDYLTGCVHCPTDSPANHSGNHQG